MGCNCGGARRPYPVITSANLTRPITPAQSAANAIANAGGGTPTSEALKDDKKVE